MKSRDIERQIILIFMGMLTVSCSNSPPPPPPVKLPRGGMANWNLGSYSYWDRNGDGRPDRLRDYWGSGYAREYFDDDFDGIWDGAEHVPGYRYGTGLKDRRIPEGLNDSDQETIKAALVYCIPSSR